MKIPSMGFTDYSNWPGGGPAPSSSVLLTGSPLKQRPLTTTDPSSSSSSILLEDTTETEARVPDQEILESIEDIYFTVHPQDAAVNVELYELEKLDTQSQSDALAQPVQVETVMRRLKVQHKVVSKKVMQMILEQRSQCNEEFQRIGETGQLLEESIWSCRKSRSYLNFAKKQLTTSNLEILATYKKRQVLNDLLGTLNKIKEIVSD